MGLSIFRPRKQYSAGNVTWLRRTGSLWKDQNMTSQEPLGVHKPIGTSHGHQTHDQTQEHSIPRKHKSWICKWMLIWINWRSLKTMFDGYFSHNYWTFNNVKGLPWFFFNETAQACITQALIYSNILTDVLKVESVVLPSLFSLIPFGHTSDLCIPNSHVLKPAGGSIHSLSHSRFCTTLYAEAFVLINY